jgi:predicted permease
MGIKVIARQLGRAPIFSLGFIALLGWGIAAETSLLSVIDAICIRPPDVYRPEQLVRIFQHRSNGSDRVNFPYLFYRYLIERSTSFATIAGELDEEAVISKPAPAEQARIALVTPEFFPLFDVKPLYGRSLLQSDDSAISGAPPAVLSYAYWDRAFNHASFSPGQGIQLDGRPFEIVGVMPRTFHGLSVDTAPDVWIPFSTLQQIESDTHRVQNPYLVLMARLKSGSTLSLASAETTTIWERAMREYWPTMYPNLPAARRSLEEDLQLGVALESGRTGFSELRTRYRSAWTLLGWSSLFLEILLCANLATLVFARNSTRGESLSVRFALGATRPKVARELLTENLILTLVGGTVGIVVAYGMVPIVLRNLPPIRDIFNNRLITTVIAGRDWRPLMIGIGLIAMAVVAVCPVPIAIASKPPLNFRPIQHTLIRESRIRNVLIAVQFSIYTLLLGCAFLLGRSIKNLRSVDVGYDTDHIATVTVDPKLLAYHIPDISALRTRMIHDVAAIPGVVSVATASIPVMRGSGMKFSVAPLGALISPDMAQPNASFNSVSPGYFMTMGMRIIAGHIYSSTSTPQATPSGPAPAVVTETFAKRIFPNEDPLGRVFGPIGHQAAFQVVGLVSDVKYRSLREPIQPVFYIDDWASDNIVLYIRTRFDPRLILNSVQLAIHRIDPRLPLTDADTMGAEIDASTFGDRLNARLADAYALFAAVLSAVGVYGLMTLDVTRRRKEIAIRLSLGATRIKALVVVAKQYSIALLLGVVTGLLLCDAIGHSIQSLLYGVSAVDPYSLCFSALFVIIVACSVAAFPLWRTAHVDPSRALREE